MNVDIAAVERSVNRGVEQAQAERFAEAYTTLRDAVRALDMLRAQPDGISTSSEAAHLLERAARWAWYCVIRQAELPGRHSAIDCDRDALEMIEKARSPELVSTLQIGRKTLGRGTSNAMLAMERETLERIARMDTAARRVELDTLRQERTNLYQSWAWEQDELVFQCYDGRYEEGDSLNWLVDELFEHVWIVLSLLQPDTSESITLTIPGSLRTTCRRRVIPLATLSERRDLFRVALAAGDGPGMLRAVEGLETWLLPDLSGFEADRDFLVIIPDRELEWVPWEILGDSTPLGLRWAMACAPGFSLARIALMRGMRWSLVQQLQAGSQPSAVLLGNPTGDLFGAEEEVERASETLVGSGMRVDCHIGDSASMNALANIDPAIDIVHIACHATFCEDEPMLSALRLADGLVLPRWLDAHPFWSAPLTVLSACESGMIATQGGEVSGLLRGFVGAGSTTLIATRWRVNDQSARDLLLAFYNAYTNGQPVASALRHARQAIYESYRGNPLHWAAYTLYGDPLRVLRYPADSDPTDEQFRLLQGIGAADEGMAWVCASALQDAIQQNPLQVRDLFVESVLIPYEDWEPHDVIPRLVTFAQLGALDDVWVNGTLNEALRRLKNALGDWDDDDPDEGEWDDEYSFDNLEALREPIYEEIKHALKHKGHRATRLSFNPALHVLMPGLDLTNPAFYALVDDEETIHTLIERGLRSRATGLRRGAAEALAYITEEAAMQGEDLDLLLEGLSEALVDPDALVRRFASNGLATAADHEPDPVLEVVVKALAHPEAHTRCAAVRVVAEAVRQNMDLSGCEAALRALARALQDGDETVREIAVRCLPDLWEDTPEALISTYGSG